MRAAAADLSWSAVVDNLNKENRLQTLAKEIESYMLSTHGELATNPVKGFIVRLGFKKDASLSFRSEERPLRNDHRYLLSLSPAFDEEVIATLSKSRVYLAPEPTKPSLFTKHKTSYRGEYNLLWEQLGLDDGSFGATEVLMHNDRGEVMGGLCDTLYFWRDGGFVTPSSESGCKLGVSRRWALENGLAKEAVIPVADVKDGEVVWSSNAVTGFDRQIIHLEKQP